MSEKTKIILDVDTGSDDAIAIITAMLAPELDLLALTTVNGNCPLENTTENTLRVVDMMKSKVPVYKGCDQPMVAELIPERHMFRTAQQSTIVDGKFVTNHHPYIEELPPSTSKVQEISAVRYLIDTLLQSDGDIVVVAVGPLTNIGVAMRADPRICKKIKKLVIMGGGHLEANYTAGAEFNIWKDPEAAQICMTSGCDILVVPLDATHRAYVGQEESNKFRAMGTPASIAVADLLDTRIAAYDAMQPVKCAPYGTTPPHDALAVCAVIDETVLQDIQHVRMDVDCGGSFADGKTMIDPRVREFFPKNCRYAMSADREKFVQMLFDIVGQANA